MDFRPSFGLISPPTAETADSLRGEAIPLEKEGMEYYTMTTEENKDRIYVNDPDDNEIELVEYQLDYPLR